MYNSKSEKRCPIRNAVCLGEDCSLWIGEYCATAQTALELISLKKELESASQQIKSLENTIKKIKKNI